MNPSPQDRFSNPPDISPAEKTLRLIAKLPSPEGLVDRVQARLQTVPPASRVWGWPVVLRPSGSWMRGTVVRGAAAAAIVCVVAGGAWGIYMRVPPAAAPTAKVIVMPARVGSSGGFSSAGAMRTPDTLKGPVLTHNLKLEPQQIEPATPSIQSTAKAATKPAKANKKPAPVLPAQ
jgi:hypothetical protein